MKPRLAALVGLLLTFGSATVAEACPSCQQALANGQGDLARGIYYSVLFMMAMPFAIVGSFGFMAYRAIKKEQGRLAEQCRLDEQGQLVDEADRQSDNG